MRARVKGVMVEPIDGSNFGRAIAPGAARDAVGANGGEAVGDGFGVAEGAEDGLGAGRGEGGEEVGEVEAEDGGLAGVGRGESTDGAAGDEAVGGGVRRDEVEDAVEDPALDV